ncbi:hypothetical protein Gotur_027976 [Gossypium turneri]
MNLPKEFVVLCDTKVPVIIFSNTGKLFGFSSSGSKIVAEKQQYSLVMGDVERKRAALAEKTYIDCNFMSVKLCVEQIDADSWFLVILALSTSSNDDKKVSHQDIELVQNLIERCLQLHMNRDEFIFDAFLYAPSTALFEVLQDEEFAPVKNINGSDYNTLDKVKLLVLRLHTR